jgi:hypothetical protein
MEAYLNRVAFEDRNTKDVPRGHNDISRGELEKRKAV